MPFWHDCAIRCAHTRASGVREALEKVQMPIAWCIQWRHLLSRPVLRVNGEGKITLMIAERLVWASQGALSPIVSVFVDIRVSKTLESVDYDSSNELDASLPAVQAQSFLSLKKQPQSSLPTSFLRRAFPVGERIPANFFVVR